MHVPVTMIVQVDHDGCCSSEMNVLCICKARRQEYNNYELGHT